MTRSLSLRETMLDAAERVASREGVSCLTFDAVAAEAGVSKGGVLHYFGNKDQLIEAMVKRAAERWRDFYMGAYESTPAGPGRMTRAILNNGLLGNESWTDSLRLSFASVLAALVHHPSLVGSMRETYAELNHFLRNDGLPEGVGEAVGAAVDGVWLNWVMRFCDVDQASLKRLHGALETMLNQALQEIAEAPAKSKNQKTKA